MLDKPPSILKICPVTQPASVESKNLAALAKSSAVPMRFKGCLCAAASFFSSLLNKLAAKGVSVSEGAMQLTLIFGASSAAIALVNPSSAPFDAATCV